MVFSCREPGPIPDCIRSVPQSRRNVQSCHLAPPVVGHRLDVLIVPSVRPSTHGYEARPVRQRVEHHHVVGPAHDNDEPPAEDLGQTTSRHDLCAGQNERVVPLDPGPHLRLGPAVHAPTLKNQVVDLVPHGELVRRQLASPAQDLDRLLFLPQVTISLVQGAAHLLHPIFFSGGLLIPYSLIPSNCTCSLTQGASCQLSRPSITGHPPIPCSSSSNSGQDLQVSNWWSRHVSSRTVLVQMPPNWRCGNG